MKRQPMRRAGARRRTARRDGWRRRWRLLLALAGCATVAARPAPDRIGRIYSYVRCDRDGSEAETIRVYRAEPDPYRGQQDARPLQQRRLRDRRRSTSSAAMRRGSAAAGCGPNAGREEFAVLTYDAAARRLDGARSTCREGPINLTLAVPDTPWHLYDFDLASLTITAQYRPRPRAPISASACRWSGRRRPRRPASAISAAPTSASSARRCTTGGARLRFEAGGPAFGDRGGPIWFDAAEGHIIEAAWGIPNHSEHRDFRSAADRRQRRRRRGMAAAADRAFRELPERLTSPPVTPERADPYCPPRYALPPRCGTSWHCRGRSRRPRSRSRRRCRRRGAGGGPEPGCWVRRAR